MEMDECRGSRKDECQDRGGMKLGGER